MGPPTFNSVGSETLLTQNRLIKGNGLEHVTSSIITDDGTNVGIGTTSPTARLEVSGSDAQGLLFLRSPTAQSAFFVSGSGNIGINDTNPTDRLVVNGRIRISSTNQLVFGNAAGGYAGIGITGATTGTMVFNTWDGATFAERMRIVNTSGNVGIGTTSPTARLHVTGSTGGVFEVDTAGGTTSLYVSASGNVGIGTASPTALLHVQGSYSGSTATFTGNVTALSLTETSTIKMKDNIRPLDNISVTTLEPVRFTWKGTEKEDIGLIAEHVAQLYPELVEFDTDGDPIGIHYTKLTVLLLKAVQDLTAQINDIRGHT